ncbi:MAG TPA: extracellular solute-binding protein, partial [Actinomycetota bacterium]|nr:extracellular solute-binding protein [Actinomycetota bacterium]
MKQRNEPNDRPTIDPALLRGLTQRRISRRDMFRYTGMGIAGAGLASFLAACGVKGSGAQPSAGVSDLAKIYGDGKPAGQLNFANWPDYIDVDSKGNSPSLAQFTKQTGIKVKYTTPINDNQPFLAKIIPELQSGQDTGYDLMILTNGGGIEPMLKLGYCIPLDHQYLPNWKKYADPKTLDPVYDPGNRYTVAWQSGFTGLGYNSKFVKVPPTSFNDLLDPDYLQAAGVPKDAVGLFGNDQDLPCPALTAMGLDPNTSTPDQWKQAADKVTK